MNRWLVKTSCPMRQPRRADRVTTSNSPGNNSTRAVHLLPINLPVPSIRHNSLTLVLNFSNSLLERDSLIAGLFRFIVSTDGFDLFKRIKQLLIILNINRNRSAYSVRIYDVLFFSSHHPPPPTSFNYKLSAPCDHNERAGVRKIHIPPVLPACAITR